MTSRRPDRRVNVAENKPPRPPEEGTYQGHPTLTIYTGFRKDGKDERITYGLTKWKAILREIETIRAWIERNDMSPPEDM